MASEIQIFINECSLQGQFFDISEFENAIVKLASMISLIGKTRTESRFFKSFEMYLNYSAVRREHLNSTLKRITQKDIRINFNRILHDKHNPENWQDSRLHDPEDIYTYEKNIVTDTSMAELAERKLSDKELEGALLNFAGSSLPDGEPAPVQKEEDCTETALLDSFTSEKTLSRWLESLHHLGGVVYSLESTDPPSDEQTVLRDAHRFKPIGKFYQDRRIYRELTTRCLWYVDNLHYGEESHLEVFNKRGKHLGKADIEGNLLPGTAIRGRNIKDLI